MPGGGDGIGQRVDALLDETDVAVSRPSDNSTGPYHVYGQPSVMVVNNTAGQMMLSLFTDTSRFASDGSVAGWAWSNNGGQSWTHPSEVVPAVYDGSQYTYALHSDPIVAAASVDPKSMAAVWVGLGSVQVGATPGPGDKQGLLWGTFSRVISCASGAPLCPDPSTSRVLYPAPSGRGVDRPFLAVDSGDQSHIVFFDPDHNGIDASGHRIHYLRASPAGAVTADCVLPRPYVPADPDRNKYFLPQYAQVGRTSWGSIVVTWRETFVPGSGGSGYVQEIQQNFQVVDTYSRYYIYAAVGYVNNDGSACPITWSTPSEVLAPGAPEPTIGPWTDFSQDQIEHLRSPAPNFREGVRTGPTYSTPLTVNPIDDHCYVAYRTRIHTSSTEASTNQSQIVVARSGDGISWQYMPVPIDKPSSEQARGFMPAIASSGPYVVVAWYTDQIGTLSTQYGDRLRWSVWASMLNVYDSVPQFGPPFRVSVNPNTLMGSQGFYPSTAGSGLQASWSQPGGGMINPTFTWSMRHNWFGDHLTLVGGVGTQSPYGWWEPDPWRFFFAWGDSHRATTSEPGFPNAPARSLEVRGSRVDVRP